MKTRTLFFKNKIILILVLIFIPAMTSCHDYDGLPCLRPEGEIITHYRIIDESFDAIHLSVHANVIIKHGEHNSVVIHAPENFLDNITTNTKGNSLVIGQNRCIRSRLSDITIEITTPSVSALSVSGSGKIILQDLFEQHQINLVVSGSGSILAELYGQDLDIIVSGSGKIEVNGQFLNQKITVSGSGAVHNRHLLCQEANVRISGSGKAYVNAQKYLKAVISGSGSIYYYGNPSVNSTISGSGKLLRIN